MRKDQLSIYIEAAGTTATRLLPAERHLVIESIRQRFGVDMAGARPPWDRADAPCGVQHPRGWELVPLYLANVPCLVFDRDALSIWRFADGMALLAFLREAPAFEYHVCDPQCTCLIACNHHDFVIGWGDVAGLIELLEAASHAEPAAVAQA